MGSRFQGHILEPDDDGYYEARQVWNAMVDKRPALIACCLDTDDVVTALALARGRGLEISVRGGGHSIVGHSVTEGGLMVDLSLINDVRIDPDARYVAVGGGALWADIDRASLPLGLAVTGGMVSHTGVAGLTLGGGYGWLARRHGLSCDNLLSAEVVTAAGEVLPASEDENEELLWGLREGAEISASSPGSSFVCTSSTGSASPSTSSTRPRTAATSCTPSRSSQPRRPTR